MKKVLNSVWLCCRILFIIVALVLLILIYFRGVRPMSKGVFKDNLTYMENAAKDYFITARLPQVVGESNKLTLGEMLDAKMIVPFTDKNGNKCDLDKSYVKVTRMLVGYELKTKLVCGSEKDYTITTLGCHDYCNTCRNEIEVISFEYRKAKTEEVTNYTCPSGYTRVGTKCNKYKTDTVNAKLSGGESRIETATVIKTDYSCPSGYMPKQRGNDLVCQAQTTTVVDYTCNSECYEPVLRNGGYVCVLKNTSTCSTNALPAAPVYSCKTGSVMADDGKCYSTITTNVKWVDRYTYTCPEGFNKEGTRENTVCSRTITSESKYYCADSSYTLSGKKCTKTIISEQIDATAKKETKTTYDYQWSQETSIEGWEKTGKQKVDLVPAN